MDNRPLNYLAEIKYKSDEYKTIFLFSLIGILLAVSILIENYYLLLCMIAVPLGLLLFLKQEYALWLLLISLFCLDWLSAVHNILPQQITWLIDIFVIILVGKGIFYTATCSKEFKIKGYDLVLFAALCFFMVSSIINSVPFLTALVSFRRYFKYLLLFYAIRMLPISTHFLKRFIIVLIILTLFQVPVVAVQFFGAKAGLIDTHGQTLGDSMGGTLGKNIKAGLAILCVTIMAFFSFRYILEGRLAFLLAAFSLVLPLALVKVTYVLIPLILTFILIKNMSRSFRRLGVLILVFAIVICLNVLAFKTVAGWNIREFFRKDEIEKYSMGTYGDENRMGRMMGISTAYHLIGGQDTYKRIFGFGPGSASQSYFSSLGSDLEKSYKAIDSNQISSTVLELGYGGILALFFMYFCFLIYSFRLSRKFKDNFWNAVNEAFQCNVITAMLLSGYTLVTIERDITAFIFWFFAATVEKISDEKKNN